MVPWAGRIEFALERLEDRLALLDRAARSPEQVLRRAAITTLGRLDHEPAVRVLEALIGDLPSPARIWAAEALPATPRSDAALERLLEAGFRGKTSERTSPGVLAVLLPRLGQRLAEREGGGDLPRDRAPLVLALGHPSPAVRAAGVDGYDTLLDRLRGLAESERTERILRGLEEQGFDPRLVEFQRARLAFFPAGDAERALASARALSAAAVSRMALNEVDENTGSRWLTRGQLMEGLALVALGQAGAAREVLDLAAVGVRSRLALREDLGQGDGRYDHVDALQELSLVQVSAVLAALADGVPGDGEDELCLGLARSAHRASLEAQAIFAELEGEALGGWDSLLDANLSPYRLLFTGRPHPGMDAARALELQLELGRVLASVSPRELPGFEPYPDLDPQIGDPLQDPERLALLESVQVGRVEGIVEDIDFQRDHLLRLQSSPVWEVPEDALIRLNRLDRRRQVMLWQMNQGEDSGTEVLLELRLPGAMALWLARDLLAEGHGAESRRVAKRFQDDMLEAGISNWWYYVGQERIARADISIGSAWTDDDDPLEAKAALEKAVERLRSIEDQLVENGAGPGSLQPYRLLRSTALVALAVNANVKLSDPDAALAYYEQAYELRKDEFMRVLLACYRARSGREVEARALLREVRPGPATWYNLACTHALLGDRDEALHWLEIELEQNHATPASLERQRAWAADDPDLTALREDPRFLELVGR